MKRIRIAQIGIGHDHAADTYQSLSRLPELYEVVGWCPVSDEAERGISPRYRAENRLTLDEILAIPDLDAVAVETDDWNLTEYAQMAAERGLDIHMDKPGAASQEAFETLARTVKAHGSVLQLGYMYRYNTMIGKVISDAKRGVYGDICSVETHMDCEHPAEKRQWLSHFQGGMLYFLGCHLIDLTVQIQGVPEQIIPLSVSSGFDGVTGEDIGMTVFRYPKGVSFMKTSACEPGGFMRRQLVVTGQKCSAELRPLEEYIPGDSGKLITRMRICEAGRGWHYDGEHSASEPADRYDAMMTDFAAMVQREKENPFTLEYECRLHRIILAACGADIDYKAPIIL